MTQLRCEIKAYKDPQEASYIAVRVTFFRVGVGEGIFCSFAVCRAPCASNINVWFPPMPSFAHIPLPHPSCHAQHDTG